MRDDWRHVGLPRARVPGFPRRPRPRREAEAGHAPAVHVTPKRIEWELYGDPRARFVTPVQVTTEGHAFALEWGQLSLDGVVLSAGAQSASVRLDQLDWDGSGVGTTGTYTLAVE